ncbi:C40 family peptidase [Actinomadura montaniterrae]|uniref:NlpC/P60 family protein n=1 Tax=Actinomadura montaniterrae TaxID=1803903 RepID=A0A6L3VRK0_9ACTN|nr:NlpC/P60 family protein [Actinomadura montaniterrae]KAB2375380.1 NlpC/P60 family protein [Actinomadura montaniterrae]
MDALQGACGRRRGVARREYDRASLGVQVCAVQLQQRLDRGRVPRGRQERRQRAGAGVQLPRVAAAQYGAGPHIARTRLRPGDLLFFATDTRNPATIHHVGLYYGRGQMIHAPQTGDVVRISQFTGNPYRERQYIGATRPSTAHIAA